LRGGRAEKRDVDVNGIRANWCPGGLQGGAFRLRGGNRFGKEEPLIKQKRTEKIKQQASNLVGMWT